MEHENYEKDVISIDDTLAVQQQKLDELSKLSTDAHDRNTLLEREVRELRKRLNSAKSRLEVRNIIIIYVIFVYYCICLCMYTTVVPITVNAIQKRYMQSSYCLLNSSL